MFSPRSAPPIPERSFEVPATRTSLGNRPVSFGAFPSEWAKEGRRRRHFHATEDHGSVNGEYEEGTDHEFEYGSELGDALLFEEWVRKPRKKKPLEESER